MVNETVVLTLLLAEPKHGYGLLEEADRLIGPDETFDTKRLYSTLRRLEDRGAIVSRKEQSPVKGAPQRKVYSITPAGFQLLRELISDPKNALDRRRFFVSLSLWVFIPPSAQRALLKRRREWLDAERRHMEAVAALPGHTAWSGAVFRFQLNQVKEERDWLDALAKEMGLSDGDD
jgi:DNA-binding PadR family transcriptional regulator